MFGGSKEDTSMKTLQIALLATSLTFIGAASQAEDAAAPKAAPEKKSALKTIEGDIKKVGVGIGTGVKKGAVGIVKGTEAVVKGTGKGIEKVGEGAKKGVEKLTGHGKAKAKDSADKAKDAAEKAKDEAPAQ
jgi:hypothetical protein